MASLTQTPGTAPHLLSSIDNPTTTTTASSSNTATATKPHDVTATFNYFKDSEDGSLPEPNYANNPTSYQRPVLPKTLLVHDIRGTEDQYTLDTTGFQIYKHESAEKKFVDDEQIKSVYYHETEELLKAATGASKIFIFDHTIRRQALDSRDKAPSATDSANPPPVAIRGPVQRVHIDQSYAAAPERVTFHLPEEAEHLLKGRFQIINVWRPIKTILKDPLGVAAANSVLDEELVPIKLVYPHRTGETYSVRAANEERDKKEGDGGHKWHYLYKQRPDEVMLIKCFDSKTDGRARRVPHSAFVDEEWVGEEPRESIEVRALVFHEDDWE